LLLARCDYLAKNKAAPECRGRVTQMALRRTNTPALFPVSAHTPRSPTVSPEHRVEFRAGSCVVTAPADASEFSCGGDRGTCPQRSVTPLAVSQLAGTRPRSPADVMLECLTTPHHTREAYPTASATNSSTTTMIPSFEGASLTLGLGCAVKRSLTDRRQTRAQHAIGTWDRDQPDCFATSLRRIALPVQWNKKQRAPCTACDHRSRMGDIFFKSMKHHGR
jgi:hypothetical protein